MRQSDILLGPGIEALARIRDAFDAFGRVELGVLLFDSPGEKCRDLLQPEIGGFGCIRAQIAQLAHVGFRHTEGR